MDAKRQQVYTGLYHMEDGIEVVKAQCAMGVAELANELNELGESVIFLGDGVPVYEKMLAELLTVPYRFAPAQMNRQRAACVASLGALALGENAYKGAFVVSSDEFAPDYLRKPQAEREREAKSNPDAQRLVGDAV